MQSNQDMYECPDNIIEKSMFGDVEICNIRDLIFYERKYTGGK